MRWSAFAAVALALAVILGAFGAHGLRGRIDDYSMSVYDRAVFYHFVHALGMLAISLSGKLTAKSQSLVCGLLAAGIVLFSGSLYVLAISGVRTLGAVTPFGGVCFIAAWIVLAYRLAKN
jgi:uncharacterized membrane protein YgdD (TMEM256/DUF423 family)